MKTQTLMQKFEITGQENGSITQVEPRGLVWVDMGIHATEDGKFIFRSISTTLSREMGYDKCYRDVPDNTPSIDKYKAYAP